MHVIAVPSIPKRTAEFSAADEALKSHVIKGFGRCSRVLGTYQQLTYLHTTYLTLSERTSEVYFGWAGLHTRASTRCS